jgi:hypothetical protein
MKALSVSVIILTNHTENRATTLARGLTFGPWELHWELHWEQELELKATTEAL